MLARTETSSCLGKTMVAVAHEHAKQSFVQSEKFLVVTVNDVTLTALKETDVT